MQLIQQIVQNYTNQLQVNGEKTNKNCFLGVFKI